MVSHVPDDLVELGRVTGAYGIRGWVKVQPYASGGSALLHARQWWLKKPGPLGDSGLSLSSDLSSKQPHATPVSSFSVATSRPQGSTVVAQLQGINDRTQSEGFKAYTVWVPRSQFPTADDDEFYWVDLVGCVLYGLDSADRSVVLGLVREVSDNGAHAVLHVERGDMSDTGQFVPRLSAKGAPQVTLVPFVKAHVHTVDLAARRLDSNWPVEL